MSNAKKPFQQKNFIEEVFLKMRDAEEYKNYKFLKKLYSINTSVDLGKKDSSILSFKHSGNSGDIIYSLPAIQELGKGKTNTLFLNLGQRGHYGKKNHPLGGVMLNEKMYEMLHPLLTNQSYISNCEVYKDQQIDYDLDLIRTFPFPNNRGNISRWYFYLFAITADLSKPWIQVTPDKTYSDHLVIARSERYNAPAIDYSFLKQYKKKIFVGVEKEWMLMKQMIPDITYVPVKNFLELAAIIAGSKLFIGNQSFPFSLAEAMKVPRLLEVYHQCPNVNVEGPGAHDFCYQAQFEKLVQNLYE